MKFKFADNMSVDDLEKVPESFRSFYSESESGFTLTDSPAIRQAATSIDGLSGSLLAARKEKDEALKKVIDLSPLASYGSSVEEIGSSFEARLEEANSKTKDIDLDKIKADLAAKHANDMEALKKRSEALQSQLHSTLVTNSLQSAVAASNGDIELLSPFLGPHVRLAEENGKQFPVVVDADGSRRYSQTTGELMTPGELVSEFKANPKFAPMFKSDKPTGGGTPTTGGGTPPPPGKADDRSATDKISAGLRKKQHSTLRQDSGFLG